MRRMLCAAVSFTIGVTVAEAEANVATLRAAPCTETATCTSATDCDLADANDLSAYACFAFKANYTCQQTIDKAPSRLDDADEDFIVAYFKARDADDKSCVPAAIQRGSFRTALWVGKKDGKVQHAVQLLPTVGIGIPITTFSNDNDAARALDDAGPIGGLTVRYTPFGFWASVHGFLGTTTLNSDALDPMMYPSPKFLIFGAGFDTLSGLVAVSLVHASLHPESLFLESGTSTVRYIQISFDLTALGILAAGALN